MIAMMEIAAPYRCPCLAIKLSAFEAKIFESRAALRFDVLLLLDLHHAENTLCAVFDNGVEFFQGIRGGSSGPCH